MLIAIISSIIPNHLILLSKDVVAKHSTKAISRVNRIGGSYIIKKAEPTHIKLCRLITDDDNSMKTAEGVIFEEESVCRNQASPYSALMQIFASSLLAKVLRNDDADVTYMHNCDLYTNDTTSTIQSMLPNPLLMNAGNIQKSHMVNICNRCMNIYKQEGVAKAECILFETHSETTPLYEMERLLPIFQENIQQAVLEWSRLHKEVITSSFYPIPYNQQEKQLDAVESLSAVIYLTCSIDTCEGEGRHLPNYKHIMAQEIPRSIKRIDIIGNRQYVNHNSQYAALGEDLQNWLLRLYPRAKVHYLVETSTIESYARMLSANYLVCRPGQSCIFPAFSTHHFASYMGPPPSWLRAKPPHLRFFTYGDFEKSYCKDVRARYGRWTLQQAPFSSSNEIQISEKQYKWDEIVFPACNTQVYNKEDICDLLLSSHFQRIIIVGTDDNFAKEQLIVLLAIFESDKLPPLSHQTTPWSTTVSCAFYYEVEIIYVDTPPSTSNNTNITTVHTPYSDFFESTIYTSNTKKSLIVVNFDYTNLQSQIHDFLTVADSKIYKNNLIFIRNQFTSHSECSKFSKPFSNMAEYLHAQQYYKNPFVDTITRQNDYIDVVLEQRKRQEFYKGDEYFNNIELLDISTISALRPDGHVDNECFQGSGENGESCVCMKYKDKSLFYWWNYLLFSNLQDVVEDKK